MIYTIKQGRHNSNLININRLWIGYGVKTVDFSFQFLNNPCYSLGNEDDMDINKLMGISFGKHHSNSFRIGWRPVNNESISLHSYYYNNGIRKDSFLYIIHYNSGVDGSISIDREKEKIKIHLFTKGNSINESIDFDFTNASRWSYRLFPYFGGNTKATHDIHMALTNDIKCEFKI